MDCSFSKENTRALFNLYAHTVAVIRLHLPKKINPLLEYPKYPKIKHYFIVIINGTCLWNKV